MNRPTYRARAFRVLREVRRKYTWPGCYPIAARMADGELLCPDCAMEHARQIASAESRLDSWRIEGAEVLWEGPAEPCSHCSRPVETAYGDPEGGAS